MGVTTRSGFFRDLGQGAQALEFEHPAHPDGSAVVEMPSCFDSLNREYRYQLTCIGGFAPVYVAEEITQNHFRIGGRQPGMKVSWMVTGIRKDPYAEQNRIEVEVDKKGEEKGTYLHPEAYGVVGSWLITL